jgi:hypothetical protein
VDFVTAMVVDGKVRCSLFYLFSAELSCCFYARPCTMLSLFFD